MTRREVKGIRSVAIAIALAIGTSTACAHPEGPFPDGRPGHPTGERDDAFTVQLGGAPAESRNGFERLDGSRMSPSSLDRERDCITSDHRLELSGDRDDVLEPPLSSRSGSEQDREEYRPWMGRRRRGLELRAPDQALSGHLSARRGSNPGQDAAQREILRL